MYKIVYFSLNLRQEDDFSPLVGFRFIPNVKHKIFSLLVQKYEITRSERYKCYILPDEVLFEYDKLEKYIKIINLSLKRIRENYKIDEETLEREQK